MQAPKFIALEFNRIIDDDVELTRESVRFAFPLIDRIAEKIGSERLLDLSAAFTYSRFCPLRHTTDFQRTRHVLLSGDKRSSVSLRSDIFDLLDYCQRHDVRCGIISSDREPWIEKRLSELDADVRDMFWDIQGDVPASQKARALLDMADHARVPSGYVLYVTDTVQGIRAAHRAGMRVCAFATGYTSVGRLLRENPTHLVNSLGELTETLSFRSVPVLEE